MLTLGELSLFLPDSVYLVKNDTIKEALSLTKEENQEEENDIEEVMEETKTAPPKSTNRIFNPVLFLVDEPLSGLTEETFTNIAGKALGLIEKDYTVLSQDEISFEKIEEINSIKLVSFGVSFSGLSEKYKMKSQSDKLLLYADSLQKIAQNVELKRQLWAQLQLMFPKK